MIKDLQFSEEGNTICTLQYFFSEGSGSWEQACPVEYEIIHLCSLHLCRPYPQVCINYRS